MCVFVCLLCGMQLPFSIVENEYYRDFTKLPRVGLAKLMKVLHKLVRLVECAVSKEIAALIAKGKVLGLEFDGWGKEYMSTKFVAIMLVADLGHDQHGKCVTPPLLSFAPLNDEEADAGALNHIDFFQSTLAIYNVALQLIKFLVADNCATNKAIGAFPSSSCVRATQFHFKLVIICACNSMFTSAMTHASRSALLPLSFTHYIFVFVAPANRMQVPLVGCAAHRLDLAMDGCILRNLVDIIAKIRAMMKLLLRPRKAAYLRQGTRLKALLANETRWTETIAMLERFKQISQYMDPTDVDLNPHRLTPAEHTQLLVATGPNTLVATSKVTLKEFQCRDQPLNLGDARALLDNLISIDGNMATYIGPQAAVVHDKNFENGTRVCCV
jgi:hypothetical protein